MPVRLTDLAAPQHANPEALNPKQQREPRGLNKLLEHAFLVPTYVILYGPKALSKTIVIDLLEDSFQDPF